MMKPSLSFALVFLILLLLLRPRTNCFLCLADQPYTEINKVDIGSGSSIKKDTPIQKLHLEAPKPNYLGSSEPTNVEARDALLGISYQFDKNSTKVPKSARYQKIKKSKLWQVSANQRKAENPDLSVLGSVFQNYDYDSEATKAPSKIIRFLGTMFYGEQGCLTSPIIDRIQNSGISPAKKAEALESKVCKIDYGLECVTEMDLIGSPRKVCRCQIGLGIRAVTIKDIRGHIRCYIPAGLGRHSECYNGKDNEFPLPFGDPRKGTHDPPDIKIPYFDPGIHLLTEYYNWNSVMYKCVPNSECSQSLRHSGKRCHCLKNAMLDQTMGTCYIQSTSCKLFLSKAVYYLVLTYHLIIALSFPSFGKLL